MRPPWACGAVEEQEEANAKAPAAGTASDISTAKQKFSGVTAPSSESGRTAGQAPIIGQVRHLPATGSTAPQQTGQIQPPQLLQQQRPTVAAVAPAAVQQTSFQPQQNNLQAFSQQRFASPKQPLQQLQQPQQPQLPQPHFAPPPTQHQHAHPLPDFQQSSQMHQQQFPGQQQRFPVQQQQLQSIPPTPATPAAAQFQQPQARFASAFQPIAQQPQQTQQQLPQQPFMQRQPTPAPKQPLQAPYGGHFQPQPQAGPAFRPVAQQPMQQMQVEQQLPQQSSLQNVAQQPQRPPFGVQFQPPLQTGTQQQPAPLQRPTQPSQAQTQPHQIQQPVAQQQLQQPQQLDQSALPWQSRPRGEQTDSDSVPVLQVAGAVPHEENKFVQRQKSGHPRFNLEQLKATDGLVRLQSGTNKFDSQKGMTGFGTPRNTKPRINASNPDLVPQELPLEINLNSRVGRWRLKDLKASDGVIPLQYGTNRFASQKGLTGFGTPRDVNGKHMHQLWQEYYECDDFIED